VTDRESARHALEAHLDGLRFVVAQKVVRGCVGMDHLLAILYVCVAFRARHSNIDHARADIGVAAKGRIGGLTVD
jgi:hypothetical protein